MWLISGPFDDEYDDGPPPTKTKLLKTGKEYPVGRKDQPLSIKNKAISKGSHVVFIVGECTEEQAADPTFVPTLSLYNPAERNRTIERPTIQAPRIKCEPHTSTFLHSEDVVHMSQFVYVRVRWEPVCCYSGSARAGPLISVKDCADLGIHVLPTLHPSITHHLTPTYTLTPALATSLVALSTFVKPEWLVTVLAAGRSEPGELSTLEETFALPPTSKFRPTFAPALPPRLKKFDIWQPNEERVGLFRGHRFVFAGEKGAEAPGVLKELVRSAEGEYECFAVENGPGRFRQVLAKGKARGSALVLVADQYAVVAAVGEDAWRALKEEARSFELKFLAPEAILEAVVYTDVSYIDSSSTAEEPFQESVLPHVIPNSIEDEPSIPPPTAARQREPSPVQEASQEEAPRRKLPRRAVSRASSRAPSPPPAPAPDNADHARESEPPGSSQPRRTLVRRAVRPKTIDDTTMDIDTSIIGRASEEPATRPGPIVPPTPGRPSRLKRRVGTQAQSTASGSQPIADSADVLIPDAPEPPHKKFKALFDASEGLNLADYGSQRADESPTQYEPSMLPPSGTRTMGTRSGGERSGVPLTALMEEEEESTLATGSLPTQAHARGTKRKSQPEDRDVEMEDVPPRTRRRTEDEPAQSTQAPQSRAETQTTSRSKPVSQVVTRVDMAQEQVHVKEKPLSKKPSAAAGAPPGEPDKDAAFLKAVASKKRGKKTEDTFDREFNNLRISKPELDRAQEAESDRWGVLEEFGDDGDVRGNFMVVMEMPIFREGGNGAGDHLRRGDGRLEWQGRPDFKKFKRKNSGQERQPVELVVEEEGDLGIGSQYWKGGSQAPPTSQPYSRAHSLQPKAEESEPEKSTTQRSTQRGSKGRPKLVADDDDSDDDSMMTAPSKPASKKKSQPKKSQPSRASSSQRSTKGTQKQPLFIDSDIEEMDEKAGAGAGEFGSDLEVDVPGSDDDEGPATLRSTATRGGTTQASAAAGRAKRRAAAVVDDDSDDGATFKAFGARTRPRKR
ncbi:hypothetical protein VTO73DRAFT_4217 [Trametes versicolor]